MVFMEGVSIKNFVKKTLKDIQKGVPKEFIIGNINFDIIISTKSSKKGVLDIIVLGAGVKRDEIINHRISFSVSNKEASTQGIQQLESLIKTLFSSLQNEYKTKRRKSLKKKAVKPKRH